MSCRASAPTDSCTGSNYIWGWETNRVARDLIADAGGKVLGERYLPLGEIDVARLIAEIQATRPDFILNNLIGLSSYAFIAAYAALGERDPHFRAERCPILSCNLTECELPAIGEAGNGHLSVGPYFHDASAEMPGSSLEAAAYASVRVLAEILAANSDASWTDLPKAFSGNAFRTPLGDIAIDPQTQHATLPVQIGRIEALPSRSVSLDQKRGARSLSVALRPRRDLWAPAPQGRVMSRTSRIPNLGGAKAFVLHRPHPTVQAISRQLSAIGLDATGCWPELPVEALAADFVFFDADIGFDEQFPWKPGEAPMPLVALIGSEAPGRIEWALSHNADAQLLKPVGNAGVYSALLIARQSSRRQAAGRRDRLAAPACRRAPDHRARGGCAVERRRRRPRLCAIALARHGLADQHGGSGAPHRGDDR